MSRKLLAVRGLLAASLMLVAGVAWAAPAKFQIEATGMHSLLSGSSSLSDQHDRSDLYPPGIGFAFAATMGVTDHLLLGVRSGLLRESNDGISPSLELDRWKHLPSYSSSTARRATSIERKLTTVATHGLIQYRGKLGQKFGFYDEFGAGVANCTDKIEYFGPGGALMRLSAYQKDLSLMFGGGLTWDYKTLATLVAGVDVEMIPSSDGQVWLPGDNPQFVHLELGFRYPRR